MVSAFAPTSITDKSPHNPTKKPRQMERRQRIQQPPGCCGCDYPSFSSTLLDSIYQSIDDEATGNRGATDPYLPTKKKQAPVWSPPALAKVKPPRGAPDHHLRKHSPAVTRPRHFHSTTSASSDCSCNGGFSSSAPVHSNLLKPIRTGNFPARSNPPPPIPPPPEKKKKNLNSIRSRFRDLKKSHSPTSPALKLAGFLNSLFTSTAGNGRKHKTAAAAAGEESACSTASSYSRSCLVKTPSMADHGVKRSVRFALPVDGGNVRWGENRYGRRETMSWREFEAEDDDAASESSSDLFELENLTPIGRYRDELPVYETTLLGGLIL